MDNKFKGVQKEILSCYSNNQLVSAGAGSGKTTIMIEKIADLILNKNVSIDNLLVVTFTVLAAQEMKDRLIQKMKDEFLCASEEKKESIISLIEKIKTASIDTIDGFSSKTIKKYFYDLEISPNIEIISDATRDYYLTRAMEKTISEISKDLNKINLMLDLFGGNQRSLDRFKEMVLVLYFDVINIEDYESFLEEAVGEYDDSLISEKVVSDYIVKSAERLKREIRDNFSLFTTNVQTKLAALMSELENLNSNFSFKTNLAVVLNLEAPSFDKKENSENEGLKELNNEIKNFLEIKKELENNEINEFFEQKNEKIINYFNIFIEILSKFIKNYNNIKEKNNLIDFNDLNRLMLKLLKNEKIRKELQEKYTYIFVDEYQDVNPLQDCLISSLVGEKSNLFVVGDVKQSIYGFRGASPELFLEKYDSLKANKVAGNVFDMNSNYRSNPIILNFINEIFSKLMTKTTADIDYANDCMIIPERNDIVDEKVKMFFVNDKKEETVARSVYSVKNAQTVPVVDSKTVESSLVLKLIKDMVGQDFYDSKIKQTRKLTYGDIAILSRSEKDENAKILIEILKEAGIPLRLTNKLDVSESEVVKLILSIIKCVNLCADDVDWLACLMSLTNLTIDEIINIRDKEFSFYENLINSDDEQVLLGFEIVDDIRKKSYTLNNAELIRYILDAKKLKYYILQKPNGAKELAQVEEFLNKLSAVEKNLSLTEFVEVVESNVNKSSDFASQDDEDSVTIQTIHKSKGLEYPVVILFNSSKIFSYLRENDAINFSADVGFGIDYFDMVNRVKMNSLTKLAIKIKNAEKGYKEEMRLLYVALTRAKNKLIITGTYSSKALDQKEVKKNSFANMILDCFVDKLNGDNAEFKNCKINFIDELEVYKPQKDKEKSEVIYENADFEYKNTQKFKISLKNSVTGLNSNKAETIKFDTKKWLEPTTQYDAEEDKALVGTHYHYALESLDLATDYVQTTSFEDVDYSKIKMAHQKLRPITENAIKIKKEADFMMWVPYSELVGGDITDKVLVQGVVDLIIEKENSIDIVDYKFSSLPIKILKEKYAEQLKLYKMAVEKAFNKKVKNTFIYSINTGELF